MSSYHHSHTNGSYSGLSNYYFGDNEQSPSTAAKVANKVAKQKASPLSQLHRNTKPTKPVLPDVLQQRAIRAAKKSESLEKKAESALVAGKDKAAAALFNKANVFDARFQNLEKKEKASRLPYTNDPMIPKYVVRQANMALRDTPLKIADQRAPIPEMALPTPVPAITSPTTPTLTPQTLPLMPPPVLLPGMPMRPMMPMQMPMPMPMPMPMQMPMHTQMPTQASPRPVVSPATAAAAAIASYLLFF